MRSRGLWLLVFGVLTGLLALAALTAVALAGTSAKSNTVSLAVPVPYATVVEAVRAVSADGVVRGTSQYESDSVIGGATGSASSPAFPQWVGSAGVFYKTRTGAIAPSHFAGAKDRGAVTVRYVVEPAEAGRTRIAIDAVFVEDSHHGRHPSQGFVESAEFGEIAKQLKLAVPDPVPQRESDPQRPASPPPPGVVEGRSAPLGRTYSHAAEDLKKALRELGAFDDAALPVLEGFATLGSDRLENYDRPYYRFRVEFEPAASGQTTVRVEAVVTARYTDPAAARPEYRALPSNGRLETDLFDRLDGYFAKSARNKEVGGNQ